MARRRPLVSREARVIALDLGTTSIKAASFTLELDLVQLESTETPTRRYREGWAEQDANELWSLACDLTRKLAGQHSSAAVVVTSVGEAGVLVGPNREPLTPAIAWFDRRTEPQARWWHDVIGTERIYAITGLPLDGSYGANKILWHRDHDRSSYEMAHSWLSIADFIQLKLSGEWATVPSLASRTMLYDQRLRNWSDELLDIAGIPRRLMPPIVESGTTIGAVTAEAADATGVAQGTPVVTGGHDHLCSALALRGGTDRTIDSTGTAEVIVSPAVEPLAISPVEAGYIACYADVEPRRYVCSARVGLAGALFEWARQELFGGASYEAIVRELEHSRRPSGLVILPTFGRPASPFFDITTAVGTVVGLTLNHRRADILYGLLEATCFSLRANIEQIERVSDTVISELSAGGGAVHNTVWLQLKADVTGRMIERGSTEETALVGSAALAAAGIGVYPTPSDAARRAWQPSARYEPNMSLKPAYDTLYQTYRELSVTVAPIARTVAGQQQVND